MPLRNGKREGACHPAGLGTGIMQLNPNRRFRLLLRTRPTVPQSPAPYISEGTARRTAKILKLSKTSGFDADLRAATRRGVQPILKRCRAPPTSRIIPLAQGLSKKDLRFR